MTTTTPEPAFSGWLRPAGGRWKKVCSASTVGECWAALLAVEGTKHTERLVAPTGRTPARRDDRRKGVRA
jgi:hypothetical protein